MKTRNSLKKILGLALTLALLLALCPAVFAAQVVLSPQKLTVDGKAINCEKYNIDGSNYFKLRDLAYVLNGTTSQFSVGWDAAAGVVSIQTGEAYTPNGSELVVGADKSSTAVPSSQTIKIDGVVRRNLSVYNIGGNNFFKLRDLGEALGFDVGYDAATNTAMAASAYVLVRDRSDYSDGSWSEVTYNDKGALLKSINSEGYVEEHVYAYDAKGRVLTHKQTMTDPWEEGWVTTLFATERYTYDANGNVAKILYDYGDDPSYNWEQIYTYDAKGNLLEINGSDGSKTTYTYDAQGRMLTNGDFYSDGFWSKVENTYDVQGHMLTDSYSSSDGYWSKVENTYDAQGNLLTSKYSDNDGYWGKTEYTYDARNNLTAVYTSDCYGSWDKTTVTCDGNGRVLAAEITSNYDVPQKEVYTYDNMGRLLNISLYAEGSSTPCATTVYTYDTVHHTYTCVYTGPTLWD